MSPQTRGERMMQATREKSFHFSFNQLQTKLYSFRTCCRRKNGIFLARRFFIHPSICCRTWCFLLRENKKWLPLMAVERLLTTKPLTLFHLKRSFCPLSIIRSAIVTVRKLFAGSKQVTAKPIITSNNNERVRRWMFRQENDVSKCWNAPMWQPYCLLTCLFNSRLFEHRVTVLIHKWLTCLVGLHTQCVVCDATADNTHEEQEPVSRSGKQLRKRIEFSLRLITGFTIQR